MAHPLIDVLNALEAALGTAAPTFRGRKWIAQHDAPPRYVLSFVDAETSTPAEVGGNPRAIEDDEWSVEVGCWGKDLEAALRLRQWLITSLRKTVNGRHYTLGRTQVASEEAHEEEGTLLVVGLRFTIPVHEAKVVGGQIVDAVQKTGRADSIEFDTSTAVAGDGQLEAPNEP